MPEPSAKPLISATPPSGIYPTGKLAHAVRCFDKARLVYRVWFGDPPRQIAGQGRLSIRSDDAGLHGLVIGDAFLPSPVEFGFHHFYLTRRGLILLLLGAAEWKDPKSAPLNQPYLLPLAPVEPEHKEAALRALHRRDSR